MMKERKEEFFEYDIEYDYKTRRLSGEIMDIEQFLDGHLLNKSEKQKLVQRLKRWEKCMNGFQEYYESIDFDSVFQNILSRIEAPHRGVSLHLNLRDALKWPEATKGGIRQWLNELYQNSIALANGPELFDTETPGDFSIDIIDENGNIIGVTILGKSAVSIKGKTGRISGVVLVPDTSCGSCSVIGASKK